jgi:hypothetical protein
LFRVAVREDDRRVVVGRRATVLFFWTLGAGFAEVDGVAEGRATIFSSVSFSSIRIT